ncbi:MAG: phage portal protein [Sphingobacterium sp.]|jgi:hypothetical protein|nr:phage portal protein [Sphingobacterium sp.]
MNISAIFRILGGDGKDVYNGLRRLSKKQSVENAIKQYDSKLHDVASPSKRPNKVIFVPNGQKDPITGEDILIEDEASVSRVPVSFEQYIIKQKAIFASGSDITLKPSIEKSDLFKHIERNWYDNKTDFVVYDLFRQVMAYTHAAVIFYGEKDKETFDDFRYKMKIVSPETGDVLEPFFDEHRDLIAFGREYKVEDKTRYDFYIIGESGFVEIRRFENGLIINYDIESAEPSEVFVTTYTKLPIVYISQDVAECDVTEEMIGEFEESFNDFCTQMGYSGEAILFGKGNALSLPAKGQAGKYMEGSADSDLKYVQADSQHESRGFQFDLMQKFIFGLNRAVFLDIEAMKGMGDVSGETLKRMLTDCYLEATSKQKGYLGMGVQRMANWLTHTWRELSGGDKSLRVYVEFHEINLNSESDKVTLAMKANGGLPVMTHQRSISYAGMEEDSDKALKEINSQSKAQDAPVPVE